MTLERITQSVSARVTVEVLVSGTQFVDKGQGCNWVGHLLKISCLPALKWRCTAGSGQSLFWHLVRLCSESVSVYCTVEAHKNPRSVTIKLFGTHIWTWEGISRHVTYYFFFLHFIGPQVYFFFLHVTTLWWYEHCVRALLDFQCLFFNVNLFGDWSRNSGFSHNKTNEEVCVLVPRFGFWDVPRGLVLWNLLVYLPDLDSSLRCDEGSKSIKMYCHSSQTGLRHQILNKSVLCWQQWHKL